MANLKKMGKSRNILSLFIIFMSILMVSACTTSTKKAVKHRRITKRKLSPKQTKKIKIQSATSEKDQVKDYVIAEPDVLTISVWKEPELSTRVTVRPDGKISFPLIGDLFVKGFTPDELNQIITDKLRKYIQNPLVFVRIDTIKSQRVFVLGAIEKAQVIPLTHKTTLLEAITIAGGIKTGREFGEEVGDIKNAYMTRGNSVLDVDFFKLLRENDMSQNIFLESGDFIYVPFAVSPGSEVYVMGEVKTPGVKPLQKGTTLVEILADSGGFIKADASFYIHVIRGGLKNPKVTVVDFRKIIKGDLKKNIVLKNRDIIYATSTRLAKWDRIVAKILPTLQMILFPGNFRDLYTTGGGLRINTGPPPTPSSSQTITIPAVTPETTPTPTE